MSPPPSKVQRPAASFLQLTGQDRVRALVSQFAEQANDPEKKGWSPWTKTLFPSLTLESVSAPDAPHPSVTFTFTVQPEHCNQLNNLHGGCAATIFDFCTTAPLALVARPDYWAYLGVSRTLSTTYLRPAPAGGAVRIECEIVHMGRRLCALRGTMRRAADGALVATCEHGRANTDPAAGASI